MGKTTIYTFEEFSDRPLRLKNGTGDDPDWATLALPPDTLLIEVGGTATAGVYQVEVIPDTAAGVPTPDPVSFTRTVETNPQIATALVGEFTTEIGDTLAPYFKDAFIATAAGTNFIGLTYVIDAPGHTLTFTAPAPGTLSSPCDGYLPLAATGANVRSEEARHRNTLAFAFTAIDNMGNILPDDNGCTFTAEVVRTVERLTRYSNQNDIGLAHGVTSSAVFAAHKLTDELRVPFDGGRFGLRISSINLEPTGYVGLEIRYRQVSA